MKLLVLGLALSTLGCASSVSTARFKDQPVVWEVDDRRDTPPLTPRDFLVHAYAADIMVLRRLPRAMELRDRTPAGNTNALDEVPDSSWFTNRIGVRPVSAVEAVRASSASGPPRPPFVILRRKKGGTNPGLVLKDATDRTFVVKFDTIENPELQTAASVIGNRFFWTMGYFVPSDHVFDLQRSDISTAPDANVSPRDVETMLAPLPRQPDGSIRASSSELLAGSPLGGFAAEGVRSGDPNDRVPHEDRREVRGLRVFAAWLDHTDMKEDNTLDMYVTEGNRRYLRHYLIDFGEALGGHAAEHMRMEDGFEHAWDWENQGKATLALGLWRRPWEGRRPSPYPSIGPIVMGDAFDPRAWREAYPFFPFFSTDAADEYWATKIVLRFDRPLVEALVASGRLSDPRAAAYLVDAILSRRAQIGRAYLDRVTPLDGFRIDGGRVCALDLGTSYELFHGGVVERLDDVDHVVERALVATDGTVCVATPALGYAVLRLRLRRAGSPPTPVLQVHVKDATRILGIVRVEP